MSIAFILFNILKDATVCLLLCTTLVNMKKSNSVMSMLTIIILLVLAINIG